MKDITKASHINIALQVIQHMNDGMTVVAVYLEVGIPRSTFYDAAWHTCPAPSNLFSVD
jgi:hypothetical protein